MGGVEVHTQYLETGPPGRTAAGASLGKQDAAANADLWGAEGPVVWVLDGASQPPGAQCCAFGPAEYVAAADQTLRTWVGRTPKGDLSLHALLAYVVAAASHQHRQHHPPGGVPTGAFSNRCRGPVRRVAVRVGDSR